EEDGAADRPPPGSGIAQGPEEGVLGRTDRFETGVDARAHLLELRPDLTGEPSRSQRLPRIRTAEEDSDAVLDRIHAEEDAVTPALLDGVRAPVGISPAPPAAPGRVHCVRGFAGVSGHERPGPGVHPVGDDDDVEFGAPRIVCRSTGP